jgi:hypothetical protein
MEYILASRTPRQDMLRKLCENLTSSLQIVARTPEFQKIWDQDLQSLKVLLWVYYIGGMVSAESLEMEWYSSYIARCMISLGLRAWSELKSHLFQLLWTETMHDQACTALWQQVQQHLPNDPAQDHLLCHLNKE